MEELLILILQGLAEFVFEVLINLPFEWTSERVFERSEGSLWKSCAVWFMVACGLGLITLLLFKHTFITSPYLRILNVALAPLGSAFISQSFAIQRASNNQDVNPRHYFWRAYWFTFGFTLMRFLYATHVE